jgi:hypothetical protein
VEQTNSARPPKVSRISRKPDDWTLSLAMTLPSLQEWIGGRALLDPIEAENGPKPHRLKDVSSDCYESGQEVLTWQFQNRAVHGVYSHGGLREIPSGVANIVATGLVPYVRQSERLGVPRRFQPPIPYRRVMTLCSGLLPNQVTDGIGNVWQVYEGIDQEIFQYLSDTLPLKELKCTI